MLPADLREVRELYRQHAHRPSWLKLVRTEAAAFGLPAEVADAALELLDSLVHRSDLVSVRSAMAQGSSPTARARRGAGA
jgi:hypothetical protein